MGLEALPVPFRFEQSDPADLLHKGSRSKSWSQVVAQNIRENKTEFSPLSRKFYVSFWSSSQYPTHIQFVLLRPMKTDLLKNTDY